MTRKDFPAYCRSIADKTGLAHWKLEFPDEPPADKDAYASVNCWQTRFGASIRIGDALLKETPEEQRHCVVHEMVHCHLAHADRLAEKAMGGREREAWIVAMEYGVDALAAVIAPLVPLPPLGEEKSNAP